MRIFEIDDEDRNRAILSGIDLDIDNQYEAAKALVTLLKKSKNVIANKIWTDGLVSIENNIKRVLDTDLADDTETRILKHKAKQMVNNIRVFRDKL